MISKKLKINLSALFLIMLGTITWSITMFKSGLVYPFGLGFWGPNGRDGIWHIAVAESLARGSLEMPIYSGFNIQNYHIGFDILLAGLKVITHISSITLYFQILPLIFAILIGLLSYHLVFNWTKSRNAANWAIFFTYFGGSLGWIVTYIRNGVISGESTFWSQQQVSTLINPPLALSLILILLALILIEKKKLLLSIFISSLILETKVYGGVLFLGSLWVCAVYQLIFNRNRFLVKVAFFSTIFSLILFLPLSRGSESFLIFQPFWFLETMMSYTDRVGWGKFFSAMTSYRSGGSWKVAPFYSIAFIIFALGNFGTRLVKDILFLEFFRKWKKLDWKELFFIVIIFCGIIFTMLFIQKGTAWNIIQFLYYSLFFSGLLAGIAMYKIKAKIKSKKLYLLLSFIIILLTIPTTISTLLESYIPGRPPAKISNPELEALSYLKKQEHGVVMRNPFDEEKAESAQRNLEPPIPIYLYARTAYISAFSNKPTYLEDEINVYITGLDASSRHNKEIEFLNTLDQSWARRFLRENNIKYIYWVKPQRAALGETQLGIERIFENSEVDIYRVK